MEDDTKKDNRIKDNDISNWKTTKEEKTRQKGKTTSNTNFPEDNRTMKDDITIDRIIMKATTEKTTIDTQVWVHRRGSWCSTQGGGGGGKKVLKNIKKHKSEC